MEPEPVQVPTVSDLPGLIDVIKTLIEQNVIADQKVFGCLAGDDHIGVEDTCAFHDGDYVIIYDTQGDTAFQRQVMVKPDNTLWLSESAPESINIARIQRLIADAPIKNVYPYDPPSKKDFPCITINGDIGEIYPLTIGGASSTVYDIQVTAYAHADNYDSANRQAWAIAREIERTLFHRVSPSACRPQIWKTDIGPIFHDQQVDQNSTLKTVTLTYTVEEVIQRFAGEMQPLIEMSY